MPLKLSKRHELSLNGYTFVVPQYLVDELDGIEYFKIRPSHIGTIKMLANGSQNVTKNACISGSPGIVQATMARNKASGLVKESEPSKLMDAIARDCSDQEPDIKKPKTWSIYKDRKKNQRPDSSSVTFTIPGFEHLGSITTRRAISLDENLQVPIDQDTLTQAFEVLTQIGIEINDNRRQYERSGKYVGKSKKKRCVGENADTDCSDGDDEAGVADNTGVVQEGVED